MNRTVKNIRAFSTKQDLYFYWCRLLAHLGFIKDPVLKLLAKNNKEDFFRYLNEQHQRKMWCDEMIQKFCHLFNLPKSDYLKGYMFDGSENQAFWNFHYDLIREEVFPFLPKEKHSYFFYALTHILDYIIYGRHKLPIISQPEEFFALEIELYKLALEPYPKLKALMTESNISNEGIPESLKAKREKEVDDFLTTSIISRVK